MIWFGTWSWQGVNSSDMGNDAFDSFRKKLKDKRGSGEDSPPATPAEGESAPPKAKEGAADDPLGASGSALDRMRAARAKLNALKGKSEPAPEPEKQTVDRRATPRRPGGAGRPGTSRDAGRAGRGRSEEGGQTGDDFESFRRNQDQAAHVDAKRRAFDEGVEVEGLDRSRIAADRATRLGAEELDVEHNDKIMLAQFAEEDMRAMAQSKIEVDDDIERPENFETGRSQLKQIDELEAELGPIEKPEGYRSHRSKKKSAAELADELEVPEGLRSHRAKRKRGEEGADRSPDEIDGFKRFEF